MSPSVCLTFTPGPTGTLVTWHDEGAEPDPLDFWIVSKEDWDNVTLAQLLEVVAQSEPTN